MPITGKDAIKMLRWAGITVGPRPGGNRCQWRAWPPHCCAPHWAPAGATSARGPMGFSTLAAVGCLLVARALGGSGTFAQSSGTFAQSGAGTFYPAATSPEIRVTGRTVANGTALLADWSSVYLEFAATGPAAITVQERWGHGNEYAVQITPSGGGGGGGGGGGREWQLNTSNATSPTAFDLGLKAGEAATVRVEKVTEARTDAGGLVRILGVTAARLLPLPVSLKRTKKLVCIGDSIMCGCHSECHHPYPDQCPSTRGTAAARESSRLSWCTVVARHFDADYQVFCESGNGLIMTDGDTCHAAGGGETCMPEKMGLQPLKGVTTRGALDCLSDAGDNRGCTEKGCNGAAGCIVAQDIAAPAFDADVFLINLGQNDYGKPAHIDPKTKKPVKSHLPTPEQWTKYYTEFVANLTASDSFKSPSSSSSSSSTTTTTTASGPSNSKPPEFFLAVGGMADKYMANTKAAVAHMNSLGHQNVHLLDITASSTNVDKSYMGCGEHPSWIGHAKAAHISIPQVAAALKWPL
eukprot:SAG22_NODE_867_length_6776_cov_2.480455_4_plen_524_part_00